MLPEAAAAPHHVLPQPRLALVHAGRGARSQRRAVVARIHALLVHGMARLVQDREQAIADVVLLDARGDAHVARVQPRAEGMMRLVEAAAIEVVAEALDDGEAEVELRLLGEFAVQRRVGGRLLLGDGAHDGHQLGAQLLEQGAHAGDRHALVRTVDQRIGDVLVGAEVVGILAAEVERLLQVRAHGGEVVGRPRARPGVVGGRAHLAPAGDELGGHPGGLA